MQLVIVDIINITVKEKNLNNHLILKSTKSNDVIYNLNFSFHFGQSVCGLTDVALMILAGIGPIESRC